MKNDVFVGKHRVSGKDSYLRLSKPNKYGEHLIQRVLKLDDGKEEVCEFSIVSATPERTVDEIFEDICSGSHFWVEGFSDYVVLVVPYILESPQVAKRNEKSLRKNQVHGYS